MINDRKSNNEHLVKLEEGSNYNLLIIPEEVGFILWRKWKLSDVLLGLVFLRRIGLDFISQPDFAKMVGLSYPTYLKKRKELEELGFIGVEVQNHNTTKITIQLGKFWGLKNSLRGSIKNLKTSFSENTSKEIFNYIESTSKILKETSVSRTLVPGQSDLFHNIY